MSTRRNYKREAESLRHIIENIAWMARRYANGSSTYAPSMYNDACYDACRLGCNIKPDYAFGGQLFARDGMENEETGSFCLPEKYKQFEADYVSAHRAASKGPQE